MKFTNETAIVAPYNSCKTLKDTKQATLILLAVDLLIADAFITDDHK